MVYAISEMIIKEEFLDNYLSLAAELREQLALNKGFIRSERFISLVDERKILSLSLWESDQAIEEWRNVLEHRTSQRKARDIFFESYTITVTSKLRSYTKTDREEAPEDSNKEFGI